jgi:hypothetical protein
MGKCPGRRPVTLPARGRRGSSGCPGPAAGISLTGGTGTPAPGRAGTYPGLPHPPGRPLAGIRPVHPRPVRPARLQNQPAGAPRPQGARRPRGVARTRVAAAVPAGLGTFRDSGGLPHRGPPFRAIRDRASRGQAPACPGAPPPVREPGPRGTRAEPAGVRISGCRRNRRIMPLPGDGYVLNRNPQGEAMPRPGRPEEGLAAPPPSNPGRAAAPCLRCSGGAWPRPAPGHPAPTPVRG